MDLRAFRYSDRDPFTYTISSVLMRLDGLFSISVRGSILGTVLLANDLQKLEKSALKTQMTIFLATLAGWLNRKQHDVIMYLNAENEILKEQLEKKGVKLRLSNAQRYKLAKRGKKLGRRGLMEYASIVTSDTILTWHRKLVALKYTAKRMLKTDRQKRMEVIQGLCVQFAEVPRSAATTKA